MAGLSTPAPGELETVRAFVNTIDLESGVDDLDTPAALGAWLRTGDAGLGGRLLPGDAGLGDRLRGGDRLLAGDVEPAGGLRTGDRLLTDDVGPGAWLRTGEAGSADRSRAGEAGPADLERAVAFREALREGMAANHARAPMPGPVLAALNAVAARADLAVELDPAGRWRARPRAPGVDGALGVLLVRVTDAVADGTWSRLKVCANDDCRWGFYDASRARTGRWCSMRLCGNRAKQQAWRARTT
jgi:predicted RNA-binding Zn ribbon-like protein